MQNYAIRFAGRILVAGHVTKTSLLATGRPDCISLESAMQTLYLATDNEAASLDIARFEEEKQTAEEE